MMPIGIVIYELWKKGHNAKDGRNVQDNLFQRVIWICVESAALYSLNNLIYLILFACHSIVQAVFSTLVRYSMQSRSSD